MKALVCVKRVVDHNVRIKINTDEQAIDLKNVKMAINPFCEIAVEEALQLREAGHVSEVVVVSVGDTSSSEQIRAALALGADRGILIKTETSLSPLNIAKALKHVVDEEQPDFILLGKQSIDGDNNQTGQMLSALTGFPQGTFASKVDLNDNRVEVTREIDGGLQTLSLSLPAIITTDLRLNTPRFASLPNIMKAKRKPIEEKPIESLGLTLKQQVSCLSVAPPKTRQAGIKVESVAELIDKLKNEAKVI